MASRTLPASLATLRISPAPACTRSFTTTSAVFGYKPVRKPFNPHAEALSKKRRQANIDRQAELSAQRKAALVDPILGRETEFLKKLDTVTPAPPSLDAVLSGTAEAPNPETLPMNHFLQPEEIPNAIKRAKAYVDPMLSEPDVIKAAEEKHMMAMEAIRRILSLGNGSNADQTRANTQLCIETFGRHNTDKTLPVDPGAKHPSESNKTPRSGPDTGSSEVQAAILTVKIRALYHQMEAMKAQNKDKHNKRNLRLLVHRRQKILKYLKRREKGGIRYRNVMDALGLDDEAVHKELFL
ncbi:S15/NS1 RNA-binding domain-containing protein [Ascodesmis nigricans]|uniref:S15/NS1 RNA-binding domain-containing protein n=1 Tax=Ascodesmis nigricans TaxID=341454 RepID=A0A4S2N7B8_9PEZI|nr:S15/NS1 RNA-binding domain-containing protein [Ascodesmis nigricans]